MVTLIAAAALPMNLISDFKSTIHRPVPRFIDPLLSFHFGKSILVLAVHACNQSRPWKRLGPSAEGMRILDEVRHLQARPSARQPMLEVSQKRHRRLSSEGVKESLSIRRSDPQDTPLYRGNKLVVTNYILHSFWTYR
jgi:hypothetical protein